MQIVELGDYSMVIENGTDQSMDMMFPKGVQSSIKVFVISNTDTPEVFWYLSCISSEFIYTNSTVVLYFKDKVPSEFKVGGKVGLVVDDMGYV